MSPYELRKKFTENAEQFDSLMVEMLDENERLNMLLNKLAAQSKADASPAEILNWMCGLINEQLKVRQLKEGK